MSTVDTIGRVALLLTGSVLAAVLGIVLFGVVPELTPLGTLSVLLIIALTGAGVVVAKRIAKRRFPEHNVAEVRIEGVISHGEANASPFPGGNAANAEEVVEQIKRADEDPAAEALLLNINSRGGGATASEEIRYAAEQFDGPTYAHSRTWCASGGVWIMAGCDEVHAHVESRIGSVGINAYLLNAKELLDKIGVKYYQFVCGDYKDVPALFRDMDEHEIEYWQSLQDESYEYFVDVVAEGRDLDRETVSETEARVYRGPEAKEIGLVDAVSTRQELEDTIAEGLDVDDIVIKEFSPQGGLQAKLQGALARGTRELGHGISRGFASVLVDQGPPKRRL